MISGQPSRTAFAAAAHRAAHQLLEGGRIFRDPLAVAILGEPPDAIVREAEAHPERRAMRVFIAVRTRFAEDCLVRAVEAGARQLVVLGAGLDTFAHRSPFGPGLRVFEVDHPATQAWKRERLSAASLRVPDTLTFAPVDFERETLGGGLAAAGFDPSLPTFFTWLGVVPYLTQAAIDATLAFMAGLPGGAEVVFDYGRPPEERTGEARAAYDARAARVAQLGEAWITAFRPDALHARLRAAGFRTIEDLGTREIYARFLPDRPAATADRGGHVLRAATA